MAIDMRIGIFGGTFDPIHYGHLAIAAAAMQELELDKVFFVPTGQPPHKQGREDDDAEQRAAMIALAIQGEPGFELSRMELERGGLSYSVDTVNSFRQLYGEQAQLWFITGADMILTIRQWMRAEELRTLCRFAAAARPGFDLGQLAALPEYWRERIHIIDSPRLDISGSEIRRRVAEGLSIRYLLPQEAENYLLRQGLYRR